MNPFNHVKELVLNLDQKQVYQATGIVFGVMVLLCGATIFWHRHTMNNLAKSLAKVQQIQLKSQVLINRAEQVKQQQAYVDALLEKDTTFKIKQYFDLLTKSLNLELRLSKPAEVLDAQDLQVNYEEIRLTASFTGLNMRDICDLLEAISKNKRIYTKEISITKVAQALDLSIVIATLQPKAVQT